MCVRLSSPLPGLWEMRGEDKGEMAANFSLSLPLLLFTPVFSFFLLISACYIYISSVKEVGSCDCPRVRGVAVLICTGEHWSFSHCCLLVSDLYSPKCSFGQLVSRRGVFTCLPLSLQTVCGYHSVQTGEKGLCFLFFLTINKLIPFLSGQPTLQVSGRLELQWV